VFYKKKDGGNKAWQNVKQQSRNKKCN